MPKAYRFLLGSILTIFFAQAAYFLWSLAFLNTVPREGASFDAIVVFGGDKARLSAGLKILAGTKCGFIVYSDFPDEIAGVRRILSGTPPAAQVLFVPAFTTVDNARNCMATVRSRGWRKIVLVTSWYHVPRARLLTSFFSAGSGVDVETVASEAVPKAWYAERKFWLEWLKVWGSFGRILVGFRGID